MLKKNSLKLLRPMRLLKILKKENCMTKEEKNWSIEPNNRKIKGIREVLGVLVDLIFRIFFLKWEVVEMVVLIVFPLEVMEGLSVGSMEGLSVGSIVFSKVEEDSENNKDNNKMIIE